MANRLRSAFLFLAQRYVLQLLTDECRLKLDYYIFDHPGTPITAILCWLIDLFPLKLNIRHDLFVHTGQLEEVSPFSLKESGVTCPFRYLKVKLGLDTFAFKLPTMAKFS